MAKELPYFKFEPNAWENGNIQMLSREDKGLFIDLCALYWSRLGDVPEKLAIQKLCGGNATALNSLYDIEAATVLDGQICIDFLNEQLLEFEDTSKTNSENAKKGWEKRRVKKDLSDRNATALNSQSESDARREEEIREDERKGDNALIPNFGSVKDYFLENGYSEEAAMKAFRYYESSRGEKGRVWKDSKGNTVKNWKQKMRGVWFKDENKVVVDNRPPAMKNNNIAF